MKQVRRAVKVTENEDTKAIHTNECVFLWEDILGMEDDNCSSWEYPEPRTWLWMGYAAFYIIGRFEDVYQEWMDYLARPETTLAFGRN
jgi:hypothetical protein